MTSKKIKILGKLICSTVTVITITTQVVAEFLKK